MSTYKVKTHRKENQISKPHFFIQSKGLHSGRPLENPIPNCFVFQTETEEEKEFYFWLSFGLWQSKAFRPFLIGSVIPFIRIGELKQCIQVAEEKANQNLPGYKKIISAMQALDKQEKNIARQLELINQYKLAVFAQYKRSW